MGIVPTVPPKDRHIGLFASTPRPKESMYISMDRPSLAGAASPGPDRGTVHSAGAPSEEYFSGDTIYNFRIRFLFPGMLHIYEIGLEILLVYTTTLLLYITLSAASVFDGDCDLRLIVRDLSPQWNMRCSDLPPYDLIAEASGLKITRAIYDTLSEECGRYTNYLFGYLIAFELFLVAAAVYALKAVLKGIYDLGDEIRNGNFSYAKLRRLFYGQFVTCPLATSAVPSMNLFLVVFLRLTKNEVNLDGVENEYCAWGPDAQFTIKIFLHSNWVFILIAVLLAIVGQVSLASSRRKLRAMTERAGLEEASLQPPVKLNRNDLLWLLFHEPTEFTDGADALRRAVEKHPFKITPNTILIKFLPKASEETV
eukprot:jgi/Mesvir1/28474/Mv15895-RA.1